MNKRSDGFQPSSNKTRRQDADAPFKCLRDKGAGEEQ
jgi:hypothetical protein